MHLGSIRIGLQYLTGEKTILDVFKAYYDGLQYLTDEKTRLYKDETSRSHD